MIPESTNNKDTFTGKGWNTKENNNYYNGNYEYKKNAYGEAMFTEKGWSTKENNNNNYYNGNNGYNGEKQGMSDTRFLENGKYFHDIRNENNYYPNQLENSRDRFQERVSMRIVTTWEGTTEPRGVRGERGRFEP
ncbi:Protein E6 [Hibiscus syriacus]|uniref:Protein E6 n=1 Tax=Hibiscus syriacus TaxID=106335 RepID=A0A6A2YE28_HIBSY|nr:Protein E6 [Hibiscus syriacus]